MELHRRYSEEHGEVSLEEFCARLLRGFVLVEDLELERGQRIAEHDARVQRTPTRDLQGLIDDLCALSMEDGLTGLFNRRYFDRRFGQELQRAVRDLRPCSIMIVDVDHFKRVNDSYGHAAGDQCLRHIADVMMAELRSTDEVTTRLGGEEFAVILPGADARGALIAGERLRRRIEARHVAIGSVTISVTISAGIVSYDPSSGEPSAEGLIAKADEALYLAKGQGRNRVVVHPTSAEPRDTGVSSEERDGLLG